jgi:hypothetical protein
MYTSWEKFCFPSSNFLLRPKVPQKIPKGVPRPEDIFFLVFQRVERIDMSHID